MAKILRILNKDYKLVNQADLTQHIVIHRVSQEMGTNRIKPKNAEDTWKKMYNVVDNCGIAKWPTGSKIQLHNKPGAAGAVAEWPWLIDSDNSKWVMEAIPEEAEVKTVPATGRRGRPPGSKNKSKSDAPEITPVEPVAEAEPVAEEEEPIDATAATDAVQPVADIVPQTEVAAMNGDGSVDADKASEAQA